MDQLLASYEIDGQTYRHMLEYNPDLNDITEKEIERLLNFFHNLGCNEELIKNIITSNSQVFSRSISDLEKLITKLREIGLDDIIDLLDANPYILNLDSFEIDNYIAKMTQEGLSPEEVTDRLEAEPALFLDEAMGG